MNEESSFSLKTGTELVVPESHIIQKSFRRNRKEHPETPMLIRLEKNDDGTYTFRPAEKRSAGKRSFVLFVPAGTKAGSKLKIQWVDPTCACTVFDSELGEYEKYRNHRLSLSLVENTFPEVLHVVAAHRKIAPLEVLKEAEIMSKTRKTDVFCCVTDMWADALTAQRFQQELSGI
jgi:hypothetical protein